MRATLSPGSRHFRPSASLVVSIVALVVALSGTAFAAGVLPKNSVGASQLKKHAVTSSKIAKGAVKGPSLAKGAVGSADLANGAVGTAKLGKGVVTGPNLAKGAVTGAALAPGAVGGAALASGAVGGANLALGAVGTGGLADGSVTTGKLADGSVTGAKLAAGSVTGSDFASGELPGLKGFVTVEPNGTVYTHGGQLAAPAVTNPSTGLYCIAGDGWVYQGGPYAVTSIGSDGSSQIATVNPYFWGSTCNSAGDNVSVQLTNAAGTAENGYFTLSLLG